MITSTIDKRIVESVSAMHNYGRTLNKTLKIPSICYFNGHLGAGKTTLIQGILQAYDCEVPVTSPTYNLIHEYDLGAIMVYHLDLYRLQDPEELETLGIRDLLHDTTLMLIEWPEKGHGFLPPADYIFTLTVADEQRSITIDQAL